MNLTAYHPLGNFDLLAIGLALVAVMGIIGFKMLTGQPWRRTLPPDEIDGEAFSSTRYTPTPDDRPRDATPLVARTPAADSHQDNKDQDHDSR